jgi:hypothetical protein
VGFCGLECQTEASSWLAARGRSGTAAVAAGIVVPATLHLVSGKPCQWLALLQYQGVWQVKAQLDAALLRAARGTLVGEVEQAPGRRRVCLVGAAGAPGSSRWTAAQRTRSSRTSSGPRSRLPPPFGGLVWSELAVKVGQRAASGASGCHQVANWRGDRIQGLGTAKIAELQTLSVWPCQMSLLCALCCRPPLGGVPLTSLMPLLAHRH